MPLDPAEELWEVLVRGDPLQATRRGDRRHDARLPDPSEEGQADLARELRRVGSRAAEVDDPETRLELEGAVERRVARLDSRLDAWNVSHMAGPHQELMKVGESHSVRNAGDLETLEARVAAMPVYLEAWRERHRASAAEGLRPAACTVRRALAQVELLLEEGPESWRVLEPVEGREDGEGVRRRVRDELAPALGELARFLREEALPGARGDAAPGLASQAGGDALYRRMILSETSLELDPAEVHEQGLAEVERVLPQVESLGRECFGARDLAALRRALGEPDQRCRDPDELLTMAREAVARAGEVLGEHFALLPRAACEVHPIPAYEAPDAPRAFYHGPDPEGTRPGRYFLNTHDPASWARLEVDAVTFHEALPGHHLQVALAAEREDLPRFRRHEGPNSFLEGWALYAERLAEEAGLFEGPRGVLGRLGHELFRACRLVVDSGLHHHGWSRTRAVQYLETHTFSSPEVAAAEVDRYVAQPGQALTYKLGELEIMRLRGRARELGGEAFDRRGFHAVVLEAGAVSLPHLEARVEAWLQSEMRSSGSGEKPSGGG